mmetsp:Transcript_10581/g.30136  ORF Transcript_10581/g.30136 Transcript_10581/m.30136 type:complete len:148 (+) Transcript_10581:464-907(+)
MCSATMKSKLRDSRHMKPPMPPIEELDAPEDRGNIEASSIRRMNAADTSNDVVMDKINRCKLFCDTVAQTASMHPTPVTATETNLARLLQQAMSEIRLQLEHVGIELQTVERNCSATVGPVVGTGGRGVESVVNGVQRATDHSQRAA